MAEERCVCCGEIIPEGRMVCTNCLVASGKQNCWIKENMMDLICKYKVIKADERKRYIEFPQCPFRLIFEDGEYVGWYYAGEVE